MSTRFASVRVRLLVCVVLAFIGVALFLDLRLPSHRVLDTGPAARPAGPITKEISLVQQLRLRGPARVSSVEVLLATWGRPTNSTKDELRVLDRTGRVVGTTTLPPGSVADNQYVAVELRPALSIEGQSWFYVSLSSRDGSVTDSITAWTNGNSKAGDLYRLGSDAPGDVKLPAQLAKAQKLDRALCVRADGIGPRGLAMEWVLRIAGLAAFLGLSACVWWQRSLRRWWGAKAASLAAGWGKVEQRYERSRFASVGQRLSEDHLLRIDLKVQIFCVAGLAAFVLLVGLGVHYSSIEVWNAILPSDVAGKSDSSLVAGRPKTVRSDEWNLDTPELLSKYVRISDLSTQQEALDLVSPWNWGFHSLGLEHGFSFMWNFWVWGSIYAVFFLTMLLSGNRFGLSVFLAVLLLFSSYNRWWGVAPEIATLGFLLVALIVFLQSRKAVNIALSSVVLFIFGLRFLLRLYPAWQVSTGYLIIFIIVGYALRAGFRENLRYHWRMKLALGIAGVTVGSGAVAVAYIASRDTFRAMMTTVYPGRRISVGGDVGVFHFFSGYLDPFFHESRSFLVNICESSGFILLFPFVMVLGLIERLYGSRKAISPLMISLAVYLIVMTVFMMLGFGGFLSRATLLSFVPAYRAVFGVGLASVLLTGLFVVSPGASVVPRWVKIASIPASLCLFIAFAYGFRHQYGFAVTVATLVVCVGLSVAVGALAFRAKKSFYAVMLAFVLIPSIWTNPVAIGLNPIYGKRLVVAVERLAREEPRARWLVYGNMWIPQIAKAAGADVFNGVSWPPQTATLRRLDPQGTAEGVWNRFAHIQATPAPVGAPTFRLTALDSYVLRINPEDPELARAGVRFFIASPEQAHYFPPDRFRRVTPKPLNGYLIFESRGP